MIVISEQDKHICTLLFEFDFDMYCVLSCDVTLLLI